MRAEKEQINMNSLELDARTVYFLTIGSMVTSDGSPFGRCISVTRKVRAADVSVGTQVAVLTIIATLVLSGLQDASDKGFGRRGFLQ